jgi:hypothetical protein
MSGNRGKCISEAEFRRLWSDLTITVAEIGERLGIGQQAVTYRAQTRRLPSRPKRGSKLACDDGMFRRLYAAGIPHNEIAQFFGCDLKTVLNTRKRLGLQQRPHGKRCTVRMDDLLRQVLQASARETQAAMWDSEMVDGDKRRRAA